MANGRVRSVYPTRFIGNDVLWKIVPLETSVKPCVRATKCCTEALTNLDVETCILLFDVRMESTLQLIVWRPVLGLTKIANFAIPCIYEY